MPAVLAQADLLTFDFRFLRTRGFLPHKVREAEGRDGSYATSEVIHVTAETDPAFFRFAGNLLHRDSYVLAAAFWTRHRETLLLKCAYKAQSVNLNYNNNEKT